MARADRRRQGPARIMTMNAALTGKGYPAAAFPVTADATKRYARAYDEDNPWFLDDDRPGGIIAPPLFGVVVAVPALAFPIRDSDLNLDFRRALHGEQDMRFLRPMRPGDTIDTTARIEAIESKSSGETLAIDLDSRNQDGEPVQRTRFTLFIRSAVRTRDAATVSRPPTPPARPEPMFVVEQTMQIDQPRRYADGSGDRTPIHLDEHVATKAGLPGVIAHGLCTMAFTSKVMIDRLAGGDPTRLRRLRVRFARPVIPGQTISTKIWPAGNEQRVFHFETYDPTGAPVITTGVAEIDPSGAE